MKPLYIIALIIALGVAGCGNKESNGSQQTIDVTVPKLSKLGKKGQTAFRANCAQCHGLNGGGTNQGPPLIHDIYNPGHHGDGAIVRAAKMGTRAHHWQFGDMPPQTQVSDEEITSIIQFIRETQRANGIFFKEHRM